MSNRVARMKEGMGRDLAPGFVARVAAGVRFALTGTAPEGWFGPGQPMMPQAQDQAKGRRFDYPVGVNLQVEPRENEPVSFRQLRALADSYDLIRLVIETRKDQLAKLGWAIQAKDPKARKADDPRIAAVTTLLEKPDREHPWGTWLRALVEDMLVCDNATLYPHPDNAGRLYALELVDGDGIKRVVDESGRTPASPQPAYQQILHGVPAVDYARGELIYAPRNLRTNRLYGFSPVEQVVMTANIAIRRQLHKLEYYTAGTVPDAIGGLPATWNADQIRQFQDYWDGLLNDTGTRRKVRWASESIAKAFVQTKAEALKDEYDEWLARIICYAFSVSNQWAVKQMNRATADTAQEMALQEGLAPLQAWIKEVMDRAIAECMGFADLEFAWAEEEDVDPASQANTCDIKVRAGQMTLDEWRALDGLDPLPNGLGAVPLIYTATGAMTLESVIHPPPPAPVPPALLGHNGGSPLEQGDGPPKDDLAKAAPRLDRNRAVVRLGRAAVDSQWTRFLATAGRHAADSVGGRWSPPMAKAAGDGGEDAAAAGAAGSAAGDDEAAAARAAQIAAAAVDQAAWEQAVDQTTPILADVAAAGAAHAAQALPLSPADTADLTSVANPRAVAWAEAHGAELVGELTDTSRDALRALVVKAETEGWSVDSLKRAIMDSHTFSADRAALIAQHELLSADSNGNLIAWRAARDEYGLALGKRWIESTLENHCAACNTNAAEGAIGLDDDFASGHQCSPAHPRCTCATVAEVGYTAMAKAFDPSQARDSRGRWRAGGGGGGYDPHVEAARGRSAMEHVIGHRADVPDAMKVPGRGAVSFVWGHPGDPAAQFKGGYGIGKVVAKHGEKAARAIPETLAFGKQAGTPERLTVDHQGFRAVLTRGGNGPSGYWVLTGYEPKP
jgi:hypothetical protein